LQPELDLFGTKSTDILEALNAMKGMASFPTFPE
jgi:hypothetical protein